MTHLLVTWGYLALFVVVLVAAMGVPTGSELVIAFAGAIASGKVIGGSQHLNLELVIILAAIAELLGSFLGYGIGRIGGRPLFERLGKYVLLTSKDLDRAEHLFEQHGEPVVFFGRFVPFIRSFVGIAAGIAQMTAARFAAFTALAAAMWCTGFALIGYSLGSQWNSAVHKVSLVGYAIAIVAVAVIVVMIVKRFREVAAERSARTSKMEPEHRLDESDQVRR